MATVTYATFSKTAKGSDEISKRTFGLNPRMRQLLILIDGKRGESELFKMLPSLDVGATLQLLLDEGFIDVSASTPTAKTGHTGSTHSVINASAPAANLQANADHQNAINSGNENETAQQRGRRVARLVTQTLGPNADDLALRIERCKSLEEIRELIPQILGVVEGVAGKQTLAEFSRKLGTM